jgi:hypothetical protein
MEPLHPFRADRHKAYQQQNRMNQAFLTMQSEKQTRKMKSYSETDPEYRLSDAFSCFKDYRKESGGTGHTPTAFFDKHRASSLRPPKVCRSKALYLS